MAMRRTDSENEPRRTVALTQSRQATGTDKKSMLWTDGTGSRGRLSPSPKPKSKGRAGGRKKKMK